MKLTIKNIGCFLFSGLGLSSVVLLLTAPLCLAQSPPVNWVRLVDGHWVNGVATDQLGNSYVACSDSLRKYDALGNAIWAARGQGLNGDLQFFDVATDKSGNAYIIGEFSDFAMFIGNFVTNLVKCTYAATGAGFVAKLDSAGRFLWVRPLESAEGLVPSSVAVDTNGNTYVTGAYFRNVISGITTNVICAGFLAKLNPAGVLMWVVGTPEAEEAIAVDGLIWVTGAWGVSEYNDTGFFCGITLNQSIMPSIAVGKYGIIYTAGMTWTGNGFVSWGPDIWTAFMTNAQPRAIATDSSGSVYVTGYYSGSDFQTLPANFNGTILDGSSNACVFLAKYDSSGSLQWVKGFEGTGDAYPKGIEVSADGKDIFLAGTFTSSITFGNTTLTATGLGGFLVNLAVAEGPTLTLLVKKGQSPALTIGGVAGNTYQVEFADSLQSGWHPWVKFVLPSSPYTLFDPSLGPSNRFYRASLIQP